MEELIKFITQYHPGSAPFISENEDGSYKLIGPSDKAMSSDFDYDLLGKCKLTARNHTKTLLALMEYIILVDAMSDAKDLSFDDEEVILFLQIEFINVLSAYFKKDFSSSEIDVEQETKESKEAQFLLDNLLDIAMKFLTDNPHIVNEALWNVLNDKKAIKQVNYQEIVDSLEGNQFEDPYINIAYEIAKEFQMQPQMVIENWSTSELVVTFSKIMNDRSLNSFLSWKYSQENAPKRAAPKKQMFFFEEIEEANENE